MAEWVWEDYETQKVCYVCRFSKVREEFDDEQTMYQGAWVCRECKTRIKETESNRRGRGNLKYRLKANFDGMTLDQYDLIFEVQRYECAISGTNFPGPRGWCVDHDHSGDKLVRGILCHTCNLLLGHYDNVELIQRL